MIEFVDVVVVEFFLKIGEVLDSDIILEIIDDIKEKILLDLVEKFM